MNGRAQLGRSKRWVIKIGSALLTNDGQGLYREAIRQWVGQMAELRRQGVELVLVSSGAVAEGLTRLGWKIRPRAIHELQAAAAVGQMGLVQVYETCFQKAVRCRDVNAGGQQTRIIRIDPCELRATRP